MRKQPNKKMVGLFLFSGFAIFFAMMASFLSDKFMDSKKGVVVMYFSESIKGLDVGSPVVFKGVKVGKVASIDIITNLEDVNFSIPVYVTFDNKTLRDDANAHDKEKVLHELVEKGLRARLATQNFLTGQLMIELEMLPNSPLVYHANIAKNTPEIPTVLSQLAELSQGIQDIPLKETVKKVNIFLDSLNNEIVPQMHSLLNSFEAVPARTKRLPETFANFNRAMHNISNAAKSLGNFADYIERHPEAILKGKRGN